VSTRCPQPAPGLVVVSGGKYTTYRVMAADAVDAAVAEARFQVPASGTAHVPLLGAGAFREMWGERHRLADDHSISVEQAEHLLYRYGGLAREVIGPVASRPALSEPVPGAALYLKAEVEYAVTHEGALHLEDVLVRRTRIAMETPRGGMASAAAVAGIMAALLGWDEARASRRSGGLQPPGATGGPIGEHGSTTTPKPHAWREQCLAFSRSPRVLPLP
jgi:glycerol-3-phosphate dehydrogenase